MKKILIVDDDAELRSSFGDVLRAEGYLTTGTASPIEALEMAGAQEFDIVLLDFMMPEMNGMDALIALKKLRPKVKVIMMTAFASVENAVEAVKKGVSDYLQKPFTINELLTAVRRVLEEARFEEGVKKLNVDNLLNTLASPIRRGIIGLLQTGEGMRLMEITRKLDISDHTKAAFHLRILKEAGIIEQNGEKSYILTKQGEKASACMKTLEKHLAD